MIEENGTAARMAERTVTVVAEGLVKAEPDVAYLSVAVATRGQSAEEAQQANAMRFAGVEQTLYGDGWGPDRKDVRTIGYEVQPEYHYTEKEGQVLKGYVAEHTVRIVCRRLAEIGRLLDALTAAGVNRTNGIQYAVEREEIHELEALKLAMDSARAKAEALALSAGRQLQEALNIVQGASGGGGRPPLPGDMARMKLAYASEDAGSSPQAGEITIKATVTVQYRMA